MTEHRTADVYARIMSVAKEQGGVRSALLLAPEIAEAAKPMQFVQVKVGTGTDPFLRRPFGLSGIWKDSGLIGITWATVGKGTSIMSEWQADDAALVLGPLGNGVEPSSWQEGEFGGSSRRVLLIAGGTGLAPLYPLAESCRSLGFDVSLFYGAKSAAYLMDTSKFLELGCTVHICTEDGSRGTKGFVTAELPLPRTGPPPIAVACGPTPMLQAVKSAFGGKNVRLYLSLEGRMACGTGLCKGCAVKAAPPRQGYLHVCSDGPVFLAEDVLLGGEE